MKIHQISLFLPFIILNGQLSVFAQGTAFSYQGQLSDGGVPATDIYDFQFYLRDALTGGNPVGVTNILSPVGVTNGLFAVTLDFGNSPFAGGASRWLEVAVRANGSAAPYRVLTPRQALLAVPYALTAGNLTGVLSGNQLSGTYSSAVTLNNPANTLRGNGAGLTGLSAANLSTGTVPDARLSANVALRAGGNTFSGAQTINGLVRILSNNLAWSSGSLLGDDQGGVIELGDSLSDKKVPYIDFHYGVTSNQDYNVRLINDAHGWLTAKANLRASGRVVVDEASQNSGNIASNGLTFGAASGEGIASQRSPGAGQWGLDFYTGFQPQMSIANSGNVGIGTRTPATKLEVAGTVTAQNFSGNGSGLSGLSAAGISSGTLPGARLPANVALLDQSQTFTGHNIFGNVNINGSDGLHLDGGMTAGPLSGLAVDDLNTSHRGGVEGTNSYYIRARRRGLIGGWSPVFLLRGDGNVGVGTDEPTSTLTVVSGPVKLAGTALSSTLVTSTGPMPTTVGSDAALANFGVVAENSVSLGVHARRVVSGTGWGTTSVGLTFDVDDTIEAGAGLWLAQGRGLGDGNVGIGTATPQAKLHVAMPGSFNPINAMQLEVGTFGNLANAAASSFLTVRDVGSGKMAFMIRGDGHVGIGTTTPQAPLHVTGMTCTDVLQITGGSDIAEPFEMSDREIAKGSLVIIDEENPGKLKLTGREYDTRVAGIVSGANGVNAGISLRQQGVLDGGQNVALSGRVYALADASSSAIKPGDLLTSSSTPGHVMKVTDHTRAQGAIVGKAMSALTEGKGMVLVLVTLQ